MSISSYVRGNDLRLHLRLAFPFQHMMLIRILANLFTQLNYNYAIKK
jgi:hypothetical protein